MESNGQKETVCLSITSKTFSSLAFAKHKSHNNITGFIPYFQTSFYNNYLPIKFHQVIFGHIFYCLQFGSFCEPFCNPYLDKLSNSNYLNLPNLQNNRNMISNILENIIAKFQYIPWSLDMPVTKGSSLQFIAIFYWSSDKYGGHTSPSNCFSSLSTSISSSS